VEQRTLQVGAKGKRPFESPEQEAMLSLLRTGDRFQIQLVRLLRAFGVTPSQYHVLLILYRAGKPLPCLEVAGRMTSAVPAITALIDRLEKAELIVRQRSAEDRRVVYITITDKAPQLLAKVDRPFLDLHRQLLGHLTPAELKELNRLLAKARESVPED